MIKSLKVFCIGFITILFASNTYGQSFMKSIGGTISAIMGQISSPSQSYSFSMAQTSVCFFPRYNFVEKENSSISVGAPVALGFGLASNASTDNKGVYFSYELPIAVDYNLGCKSTPDNDKNFGGYFGVGFSYYKVNISQNVVSDFNGATYGPMIRLGMRLGSSRESWDGRGITIGTFFKTGLEKNHLTTIGFHILLDLQ